MKKRIIPITAIMAIMLTSCGGTKAWSWSDASSDGVLKYCLLIGQTDHNDSAARTGGIREALHTRPTATTNANTEKPIEGEITLNGKTYKVQEIEHAEQKNNAGATWDQQTATSTAETWINKHGNDIDFFVSNNDGMAEGAIGASNWIEGMPIFGYDSNNSTLDLINQGKIMGTINQNASAQVAGIFMLARNCIDGVENPIQEGFTTTSSNGYGKISSEYNYNEKDHSMLVNNFAITKNNVNQYLNKSASDLVDENVSKGTTASKEIFLDYYNNNDTFLNSNMKPLFNIYKDKFNFSFNEVAGDSNSEASVMDRLIKKYDGYCINMVKTTAASSYLDKIYELHGSPSEKIDAPVIFWNRQPTQESGVVNADVMKDNRFSNIYYVGFDAIQGGKLQGQMIVDFLLAQK